jgi:hypothetical protein
MMFARARRRGGSAVRVGELANVHIYLFAEPTDQRVGEITLVGPQPDLDVIPNDPYRPPPGAIGRDQFVDGGPDVLDRLRRRRRGATDERNNQQRGPQQRANCSAGAMQTEKPCHG